MVRPVRFDLGRSAVRRAGLDYWDELRLALHDSPDDFLAWLGDREPWLVTRHGRIRYDKPAYRDEDVLVFGSETQGLPQEWRARWTERTVFVPVLGNVRNYNLANTVSVVLAQATLRSGLYDRGCP